MRFYRVDRPQGRVSAVLSGRQLTAREWSIEGGVDGEPGDALGAVDDLRLASPLKPGKIIAIGLNYRDHIAEAGVDAPGSPLVFAKFPSSVVGPHDQILVDQTLAERVDWEVELGVVIGQRARSVPIEGALDVVFGYTVANDISARDVQFREGQWTRGKSFDTFCPLGPCIVSTDEIPDPQRLTLRSKVNGEVMQEASTELMVFSVAELIAFCSQSFTLEPGDLIMTGTPWGCGEFMDPRRCLSPGDTLESEVEGIGALRNRVVSTKERGRRGSAMGDAQR